MKISMENLYVDIGAQRVKKQGLVILVDCFGAYGRVWFSSQKHALNSLFTLLRVAFPYLVSQGDAIKQSKVFWPFLHEQGVQF